MNDKNYNTQNAELGKSLNSVVEKTIENAVKIRIKTQEMPKVPPASPTQKNSHAAQPVNRYARPAYPKYPIGHVSGILLTIFGIIGVIAFGVPALILALVKVAPTVSTVFTALAFISLYGKIKGDVIRKRLKRYQKYVKVINNRTSCTLKELSNLSRESEKYIYKDLKRMVKIGMFPEANFNSNKTVFMLTKEKYLAYLKRQDELEKELQIKKSKDNVSYSKEKIEVQNDWSSIQRVSDTYIKTLNALKESLTNEALVEDIYRTEILTTKIVEVAQKKSKAPDTLRRFMNYYLPETIKLLKTYETLDKQPVQGVNIISSKEEIASGLKSINLAFEKIFDSLFENEALNVSTDISVLNTVFSQNGLTEDDMNPTHKGV